MPDELQMELYKGSPSTDMCWSMEEEERVEDAEEMEAVHCSSAGEE